MVSDVVCRVGRRVGYSNRHASILAGTLLVISIAAGLVGCASPSRQREPVDPDVARAEIERLLPTKVQNRSGWAVDIFAAFEALEIAPTADNICAVVGLTDQESNFQVDPPVPGLPAIARKEIHARAENLNVPRIVVGAALELRSPNGVTYRERLASVRTERGLSELYEDFIGMVPLGGRLFANLNPVRTGGPMQVSIAYAEQHADRKRYPYPLPGNIRHEVFTRRGGMYFGIAHLLDYPVPYDEMLFRFADYNAGHYASRNAAFQNAVNVIAGSRLALDGDLLLRGSRANEPSSTELAIRKVAGKLEVSDAQIRSALERGEEQDFERTILYSRVFALADAAPPGRAMPRAMVPRIRLASPKITRRLTTDWFAQRVDGRYKSCLARASRGR
jgi:hypothetical protein